jgi:hypothetical protein
MSSLFCCLYDYRRRYHPQGHPRIAAINKGFPFFLDFCMMRSQTVERAASPSWEIECQRLICDELSSRNCDREGKIK